MQCACFLYNDYLKLWVKSYKTRFCGCLSLAVGIKVCWLPSPVSPLPPSRSDVSVSRTGSVISTYQLVVVVLKNT